MSQPAEKLLKLTYPLISLVTRCGPISRYPALYFPYARLFKTGPHPDLMPWSLPDANTQLVIEEPGSCANHSLATYVKKHNPDLRLATLTHSAAPARFATRHGIPCIVLTRDILGFVCSSVSRFPHLYSPRVAARIYTSFYKSILPVIDRVVVAQFQDVIRDPREVIRAVNGRFSVEFNLGDGALPHIRGTAEMPNDGYPPAETSRCQNGADRGT